MIPFRLTFQPGESLCDQAVYAVKRAIVAGKLRPGDPFPSVRTLSRELRINPNTAHKVVTQLVREGLLEVLVGQGTVVSTRPTPGATERSRLLREEMEKLVVEAKKLGMELDDVLSGVERYWRRFGDSEQLAAARGEEGNG
ncbi:MAG TPA: GntR family transcriptional regulator [Bryobacteraceae bacterium]|nr:GntR family transcriptional regulator [Bryobacteraceae bacterium]